MLLRKRAIVTIIFLFIEVSTQATIKPQNYIKTYSLKKDEKFSYSVSHPILSDDNVVSIPYLSCVDVENAKDSLKCSLVHLTHTFDNRASKVQCDLDPGHTQGSGIILPFKNSIIRSLGNNKFYVLEQTPTKVLIFHIVDTSNCKTAKFEFPLKPNQERLGLVEESGSISIIVNKDEACANKQCIFTFDPTGKQVGYPVPFLKPGLKNYKNIIGASSLAFTTPTKTYFTATQERRFAVGVGLYAAKENSEYLDFGNLNDNQKLITANENSLFSICSVVKATKKIQCTQVDNNMKVRVNATLDLQTEYPFASYNLKNGGLLLWTASWDLVDDKAPRALKIFEDGHYAEITNLNGVKCDDGRVPMKFQKIYENSNDICFSVFCHNRVTKKGNPELEVNAKCLPKNVVY